MKAGKVANLNKKKLCVDMSGSWITFTLNSE